MKSQSFQHKRINAGLGVIVVLILNNALHLLKNQGWTIVSVFKLLFRSSGWKA